MPYSRRLFEEPEGRGDVEPVGPLDGHAAVRAGEVALVRPGEGQVVGPEGAVAAAGGAAVAAGEGGVHAGIVMEGKRFG